MSKGAQEADAEVEILDLKELAIPVYDGDIEDAGFPESANTFRQKLKDADGIIICTPEYNHSMPGGLKNAIDWASRGPAAPFKNKYIALAGCSTGLAGTIRSQLALLPTFRALGGIVISTPVYISFAQNVFDADGKITDHTIETRLMGLGKELVEKVKAQKG